MAPESRITEEPEPLNAADLQSATWAKVRAWAEYRLRQAREQNDSKDLDYPATCIARGQIMVLKNLLALEHPAPAIEPSHDAA